MGVQRTGSVCAGARKVKDDQLGLVGLVGPNSLGRSAWVGLTGSPYPFFFMFLFI